MSMTQVSKCEKEFMVYEGIILEVLEFEILDYQLKFSLSGSLLVLIVFPKRLFLSYFVMVFVLFFLFKLPCFDAQLATIWLDYSGTKSIDKKTTCIGWREGIFIWLNYWKIKFFRAVQFSIRHILSGRLIEL